MGTYSRKEVGDGVIQLPVLGYINQSTDTGKILVASRHLRRVLIHGLQRVASELTCTIQVPHICITSDWC